jgi:hypothetical protein
VDYQTAVDPRNDHSPIITGTYRAGPDGYTSGQVAHISVRIRESPEHRCERVPVILGDRPRRLVESRFHGPQRPG